MNAAAANDVALFTVDYFLSIIWPKVTELLGPQIGILNYLALLSHPEQRPRAKSRPMSEVVSEIELEKLAHAFRPSIP